MAKEKQTRRMMAMALAAAVTMSSVPVVAFAEDGVDAGITTESGEGTKEDPKLKVTVTVNGPDASNQTTTVTKTETDWDQQLTKDTTVNFDGEKVDTVVTVPNESSDTDNTDAPADEVVRDHHTTDDTTTTVQTTEDGATTTVENVQTETGTREDGTIVDSKVTNTQVTETDADGNVVEEYETEVGSERLEETVKEDKGDGDQPDVEVELEIGKTTSQAVTSTTTTGDTPIFDFDTDYDYTVIEEVERTVTANTSEIKVTVNDPNAEGGLVGEQETDMEGLAPVYDYVQEKDADGNLVFDADGNPVYKQQVDKNGKPVFDKEGNPVYVKEDKGGMFDYQFNSGLTSKYAKNPENWDMPDGADVRFVGTGEHSKYYVATAYVEYEKDADGNTIYDEDGNPVIKELRRYSGENNPAITIDGQPVTELPEGVELVPPYDNPGGSRPFIFALMDENGNSYYAYCCDLETDADDGWWYSVSNLEDSDYYASKESADHIRSIVMNGYWGTSDIPNEDGSYNTGSLEKIKADMKAAIANKEMPDEKFVLPDLDEAGNPVVDEAGAPVMKEWKMSELIDHLTEGEALLATQAAIWSFANGSYDVMNGKDGSIVLDPDGYKWNHNPTGNSKAGEAMTDYSSAAVDFMYKWLINLKTKEESTVVVNEKNFVEDMSLVVGDKVENHENNQDDNVDNDVYNTALNFKLAFIPDKENDDLLVQVTYKDMEGKDRTVVRRLAGENAEGQTYEGITPEADGSYVISGLQLSENEDFNFDLRLEGTQYLEQGVYVYAPVGGRDVSQTFVGIAEGERNVDVSMGVTVSFDVDENDRVVATRKWSKDSRNDYNGGGSSDSKDPVTPPEDPTSPGNPGGSEEDDGMVLGAEDEIVAEDDGMVAGAEENIADAEDDGLVAGAEDEIIAATADSNHMAGAGASMFAALAGLFMLGRKKKTN